MINQITESVKMPLDNRNVILMQAKENARIRASLENS